MRLHYSADPEKDPDVPVGFSWLQRTVQGFPGGMTGSKWQQEYEINFHATATQRIFPNWEELYAKIVCPRFDVPEHWPLYAGFDYGTSNPFAFIVVAFKSASEAFVIDEISEKNWSVAQQSWAMKTKPYFNRIVSIIGDRAIWSKTQNVQGEARLKSIGEMFQDEGIYIERGRNETGVDNAFIELLKGFLWYDGRGLLLEEPRLILFEDCRNLLRNLRKLRRLEFKSMAARMERDLPEQIVSKDVDCFDALKYLMLSRGYDEPSRTGIIPGTVGWYRHKIKQAKRRRAAVLQ